MTSPKDLKSPFTWNDRHVVLDNRVLHVPTYYDRYEEFTFPGWSDPALFGNDNPVEVEYCAGNGLWISERARGNPHINYVAVEKRFDRVRKIWAKIQNFSLNNLIVVCGEAHQVTNLYFPENSISGAYVNFPDPWPKKRHAKHRLIHSDFLTEVRRVLLPDAPFTFVTDDPDYTSRFLEEIDQAEGFGTADCKTDCPDYGTSYFDTLWRRLGRTIHYTTVNKTDAVPSIA